MGTKNCLNCGTQNKETNSKCEKCNGELQTGGGLNWKILGGAFGGMALLLILIIAISGCGKNKPSQKQTTATPTQSQTQITEQSKAESKFEFIESKTEPDKNKNKMDLYTYFGDFNLDLLKSICKENKQKFSSGTMYFLVVFDNKDNTKFPEDPFSAEYGVEEEKMKHIKAMYTYNRLNGYSKLDYYDTNMWESVAKTEDI